MTRRPHRAPFTAYHWAPADRRPSIRLRGLRPGYPSIAPAHNTDGSEWRAPHVCLGITPADAWRWSLAPRHEDETAWDLWQVAVIADDRPRWRGDTERPVECRIAGTIPPRRLWLAGTRDCR